MAALTAMIATALTTLPTLISFFYFTGNRAQRAFNVAAFLEISFGIAPVGAQSGDLLRDGRETMRWAHSGIPSS